MAKQALARSETATPEREEAGDGPLMDNMNQAVKNLITKGKERGYLTYDDVNSALPEGQNSSEQIEDVLSSLNEMGVNVVDGEESEEPAPERKEDQETARAGNVAEDDGGPDRRSGPHVPARDGQRRVAVPRGRDRDCQADRGRPRTHDRRRVREPARDQGADELDRGAEERRVPAAGRDRSRCHLQGDVRRPPAARGKRHGPWRRAAGAAAPERQRVAGRGRRR